MFYCFVLLSLRVLPFGKPHVLHSWDGRVVPSYDPSCCSMIRYRGNRNDEGTMVYGGGRRSNYTEALGRKEETSSM